MLTKLSQYAKKRLVGEGTMSKIGKKREAPRKTVLQGQGETVLQGQGETVPEGQPNTVLKGPDTVLERQPKTMPEEQPKTVPEGQGKAEVRDGQREKELAELLRSSLNERRDAVNGIHQLLAEASIHPAVADSIVIAAAHVADRALGRLVEDGTLASELEFARSLVKDNRTAAEAIRASEDHFEVFLNTEYLLLLQYGVSEGAALELVQTGWTLRQVAGTKDLPDTNALREVWGDLRSQLAKGKEMRHKDGARWWKDKIRRAGLMVGGALIVGVNSLIGAGCGPVTGGLSIVGAAVSEALGGVLMGKAVEGEKPPEGRPLVLRVFTYTPHLRVPTFGGVVL
jgi:hypothetical protein